MLNFSAVCRRNLKSVCILTSLQKQAINENQLRVNDGVFQKKPIFINSRCLHQSHTSGEVLLGGCEKLPDLTLIWPFHLWPSDIVANSLNGIQLASGLPWWCTILVGGALLKVPLFGFNIYNFRRIQQAFVTSPRQFTHFLLTYLNNLITKGEVHALKMANNEQRFTLFREGMDWEKSLKPKMYSNASFAPIYWLVFMHVSMFTALHWLNRINYIPLTSGGLPWSLDLTSPDPYMVLPVICLMSGLFNLYLHPMHWLFPLPEIKIRNLVNVSFLPVLAVIMSILSSLPGDYLLYMISANFASCILNFLIKAPGIYTELGLLSSGESFNRIIPPSKTFTELNKTLDRQLLLLEQKKSQASLSPKEEQQSIDSSYQKQISSVGIESSRLAAPDTPSESSYKSNKSSETIPKLDNKLPHLNVKKVFDD